MTAPIFAVKAAVLHCLGDMILVDFFAPVKVGNRARDLDYAVIGAGRQAHAFECAF